jgi:DNA modification methylase
VKRLLEATFPEGKSNLIKQEWMFSKNTTTEEDVKVVVSDALDFLKSLPSESVDLIVTDPPYNSSIEWDRKDDEWQFAWLEEAKRVMKDGASIYVFFAPLNMYGVEGWIRENLTLKNICVWYHPNLYGAGLSYGKDRYKSSWDVVFYAVKGKSAKHGKNVSAFAYDKTGSGFDVFVYPQPRPLLHKAQKPLELIEKLILCSSEEGDLVVDPFLGSGTTAIACKFLKRKFVGCDANPKFVELAKIRLQARSKKELKLIDEKLFNEIKATEKTMQGSGKAQLLSR